MPPEDEALLALRPPPAQPAAAATAAAAAATASRATKDDDDEEGARGSAGGVAAQGLHFHHKTSPSSSSSSICTSLELLTAGASARLPSGIAPFGHGPVQSATATAFASATAALSQGHTPPMTDSSQAAATANGSGTQHSGNGNDQQPHRTSTLSTAAGPGVGVGFPSLLLSSIIPPGSTVRPSAAIEAHVHASIKGAGGFAVPPLASSLALPLHSSSLAASASDVLTPEVFRNRRLRSGKWIKEEEQYADLLIEQFEAGVAPDCPNGVTLRAYLSKKLHCAPMRISKKFAGKGIGKLVFVSRLGSDGAGAAAAGAGAGGPSSSSSSSSSSTSASSVPGERRRREALVKEREDRFYKAAFRSNDFLGIPYGFVFGPPPTNPIVIPPHPPQMSFGVAQVAAPPRLPFDGVAVHPAASAIGAVPILPQIRLPVLPVANAAGGPVAAPAGGPNQAQLLVAVPTLPAQGTVAPAPAPDRGTVIKPRPGPPPVPPQAPVVALNEQTLKLHQSYLSALQQHPSLFSDPPPKQPSSSSEQSSTSATRTESGTSQVASGLGVGKPLQWRPSQPLHPGNAALGTTRNVSITEAQSNAAPTLVAPAQHQASLSVPVASSEPPPPVLPPPSPLDPLKDLASSAPDFLSGFDRVALSLKPSPCDTEKLASLPPHPHGDLHCSPTFTSRSFDDFHRFLGQDLVHLGSPARPPTSHGIDFSRPRAGSESAPPMLPVHATDAPSTVFAKRPSAPVLSLEANGGSSIDVPSSGDVVQQSLLRSSSQEANSMFSADSYCLFASAAVAASSQHAAYSAPPGALFGMAHSVNSCAGEGKKANGHGLMMKRNRADTFDMESTMNIVSAHVGGLQRQEPPMRDLMSTAERTRTFHCSTVILPTPRETMWERMYGLRRENGTAQLVSGSEPSTSSATTETESGNGSFSGNASPNDSDEPSDRSEDSSSCCSDMMSDGDSGSQLLHSDSPKTKKARSGAGDAAGGAVSAPGAGKQAYTL